MKKYTPIIGLEVHIELKTRSKMFCSCSPEHFGKKPNSQVCPICLGLPGTLPFANQEAIKSTLMLGLALGCKVNQFSKFDRKHYFYPDLPKGYQISQYDRPLCSNGQWSKVNGQSLRIRRIHLEEDTAKLVHESVNSESQIPNHKRKKASLVDFNRSGVALLELVTEPDFREIDDVIAFLKEIQLIARYLGISDTDMEKGSLRLEANISLQPTTDNRQPTTDLPDYKVELKNINSFRFLRKALEAEIKRQTKLLSKGEKVIQETRGYSENKEITFSQRTKEEAHDYRYFPEPDIPPIRLSGSKISNLKSQIPKLPENYRSRFRKLGLPENYVEVLVADKARAEYFEASVMIGKKHQVSAHEIAKLMVNQNLDREYPEPAGLVKRIYEVTNREFAGEEQTMVTVKRVLKANQKAVVDYKKGKTQVIGFIIGQVQKELGGKGNTKLIKEKLVSVLNI